MPWASLRWLRRQRCGWLPGPRQDTQSRRCPSEHTWAALPVPLAVAAARKTPGSFHPAKHLDAPPLPTEAECWRSALSITYGFTHKYLSLQGNSHLEAVRPLGYQGGSTEFAPFRNGMPWPGKRCPGWFLGSREPAHQAGSSLWGK